MVERITKVREITRIVNTVLTKHKMSIAFSNYTFIKKMND